MRDEEKGGENPIEEVEKLRTHKAKLERVSPSTKKHNKPEKMLQATEDLYRAVMDNNHFGFTLIDRNYRIIMVNSMMSSYFHKPAGKLIGRKCFREFEKRGSMCPHCPGKQAMATGRPAEVETEKVRDDGSRFPVCIQAFPAFGSNGAVTGFIEIVYDITERKKAEETLRESEVRFRTVADYTYDWEYWIGQDESSLLYVSPSCQRISGYQSEDFVDNPGILKTIVHPDDRTAWVQHVQQEHDSPLAMALEYRIITKDGQTRWIEHVCQPVYDPDGLYIGRRASNRDITERKRAEEALRESEEKFKGIFDHANDGIIYLDSSGRILDVNEKAVQIFGGQKKQVLNRHFTDLDIFSQSDKPILMNNFKMILSSEEPVVTIPIKNKKGQNFILECSSSLTKKGDEAANIMVIARDITERKKADATLRLHSEIMTNMVEGIILTRVSDATIVYTNPKFEEMFGYSHGELVGKNISVVNAPTEKGPEEIAKYIQSSLNKTGAWSGEVHNIKKDGTPFWCYANVSTFGHPEYGKVWVAVHTDITERKKVEEDVKALKQQLEFILGATKTGLDIIDSEFNIRFIDTEWKKIYGDPTGKKCYEYFMDRSEVCSGCGIVKALETKTVAVTEEVLVKENNRPIQVITIPFQNEKGEWLVAEVNVDIAERKKAEEALKKSEEKFRNIFENSNVGISVTSLDGTFNANIVFCDMLGYSKEELSRLKWTDITHQEDIALSNNYLGQLRSGKKKSVRFQKRYVKKDGSIIFADTSVTLQKDKDGKPPYYITTIMDITERKNMEEALRRNEARYRSSIELTGQLAWTTDSNGEVVEDISLWRKFTGLSYEETKGSGWTKALHPEDAEHTRQVWGKAVKDKKAYEVEYRLRRFDGVYRGFLTRGIPVFKEDGSIREWVGVNIDITDRGKASKALAQSESKFRSLVGHLPQKIFVKDKNSVYLFSNQSYAQDLKIKPEEIIGKTDYDFYSKELAEKYRDDDKRIIKTGEIEDIEENYIEHGKERWVHTIKTPYKDEEGNIIGVLGIFRDITERKKLDKKIYDYQQQLKALGSQLSLIEELAKRKIAAGLHDNIGQKLAVAKLELQSLMRSAPGPDTKMSDSINSICGEITHIIDDVHLLTFELGNPLLYEIGLTVALEKYITEEIQAKFGIKCELNDEAGAQDLEETVRTVLYRSTRELLINSVKHAQAHNIKVRIYQSAGLPPRLPTRVGAAGNIHVCVEDDGVGFEVSEIVSLPNKTGGFGLFSIKEQLEYIGGNLHVESRVGHGTKVTIGCPPKLKRPAQIL